MVVVMLVVVVVMVMVVVMVLVVVLKGRSCCVGRRKCCRRACVRACSSLLNVADGLARAVDELAHESCAKVGGVTRDQQERKSHVM